MGWHPDTTISNSPQTLLVHWLKELRANDHAFGTIRRYKSAIESYFAWYAEVEHRSFELGAMTPIVLIGYRTWLQQRQGRATSTVNGHVSALKAWCAWLTEHHHLETNPAKRIKLVGREAPSSREGLKSTEVNALLRQVQLSRESARNYAIVQLLLQTGIRLDECSGRVTIRHGKGNKARTVPLNASARQALAEYLAMPLGCDPTIKAVAAHWPHPSPRGQPTPLWKSQKGGALTTSAMRQMIDEVIRAVAVWGLVPPKTCAHTLCHTFAHNYLEHYPGDIVGLATLLGHTSLDTTRLYSQPTLEQLGSRVDQLHHNAYHG